MNTLEPKKSDYSAAAWAEIVRVLAGVGVDDADDVTVSIYGGERYSIRDAFLFAAGLYFQTQSLKKAMADVQKDVKKLLRQLEVTERHLDEIITRAPWLEGVMAGWDGTHFSELRNAKDILHKKYGEHVEADRVTKKQEIYSRLRYFHSLAHIFRDAIGDPLLPCPIDEPRPDGNELVLGNADGPMVRFLHAASGPVLGKKRLTKQAIHSLLKRNWSKFTGQDLRETLQKARGQKRLKNNQILPTSQA